MFDINNIEPKCSSPLSIEEIKELEKEEEEAKMDISVRLVYSGFGNYEAQVFDNNSKEKNPLVVVSSDYSGETALRNAYKEYIKKYR